MLPAPNKFPIQKADRNRYYREVQKVRAEFPYASVYGKINPYNKRKILSENDYDLYCHSYAVLRLYEKSLTSAEYRVSQERIEAARIRSEAYQYAAYARKYVLRQRILSAVLAVVAAIAIGFSAFSRRSVPADPQPVSAQPSVSQAAAAPSAAPSESPSVAEPAPAVEQPTQTPQDTPPASSPSYTASGGSSRPDPYISDSYIGNRSSHKFHRSTCSFLPNPENQVIFDSASDALAAGYEPCKKCNP